MKDNSFKIKIILGILITVVLIVILGQASLKFEEFFQEKNKILRGLDKIKHSEIALDYTISTSGLYLYKSNDSIYKAIEKLQFDIKELLENSYFKENYPQLYREVQTYNKLIDKKIENTYEFQTYSSAIKNSIMYISRLLNQLPKINAVKTTRRRKDKNHYTYVQNFIDITSKIFLSKNSMDKDILNNLDLNYFKTIKLKNKKLQQFNNMFLAHTNVYYKYYPKYNKLLLEILDLQTQSLLEKINEDVYIKAGVKLQFIKFVSFVIEGFIIIYTMIIIFLLIRGHKENIKLNELMKKLSLSIRTDSLTSLSNRRGFDKDIQTKENQILYLVNIDKFKNINNYYGSKMGDLVLVKVANILQNIIPKEFDASFYRLGSDDFGILVNQNNIEETYTLSNIIVEYFEKTEIHIDKFSFKLGISVGITSEKPYFETSNIALKEVRNSTRLKSLQYSLKIDNKDAILRNIENTKRLYDALQDNRVVPYFQPIIDVNTQQIVKYEVLSRVVSKDGTKVESIYPYLQIAKDNKLYSQITKMVLTQSIKQFKDNNIPFNVNFSIEDIMDDNIMLMLDLIQKEYKDIMPNITFELLESESINDYNIIKNFITNVKSYGSKVAIDDFGSGYSNFEHIINLDIDYIKIDGSLIKNIATDKNSYNIVNLVNQFAKSSGIQTVGEFVENVEIYETMKEIGIDYAQGYYFGKPTLLK